MSDEHQCTGGGDGHRHDITCREIAEFLLAYLDRELPSDTRAEFERHLHYCPPCGHYLDGYRETIELVRRCVRGEQAPASSRPGNRAEKCNPGPGAPKPPPEGLIQAILAAKRGL